MLEQTGARAPVSQGWSQRNASQVVFIHYRLFTVCIMCLCSLLLIVLRRKIGKNRKGLMERNQSMTASSTYDAIVVFLNDASHIFSNTTAQTERGRWGHRPDGSGGGQQPETGTAEPCLHCACVVGRGVQAGRRGRESVWHYLRSPL